MKNTATPSTCHRELEGRSSDFLEDDPWRERLICREGRAARPGMAGSKGTEEVGTGWCLTNDRTTRLSPVFHVPRTGYHRRLVAAQCSVFSSWSFLSVTSRRVEDEAGPSSSLSTLASAACPRVSGPATANAGTMQVLDNLCALGYVVCLLLLVGESFSSSSSTIRSSFSEFSQRCSSSRVHRGISRLKNITEKSRRWMLVRIFETLRFIFHGSSFSLSFHRIVPRLASIVEFRGQRSSERGRRSWEFEFLRLWSYFARISSTRRMSCFIFGFYRGLL